MTSERDPRLESDGPVDDEAEFTIARSKALIPLLVLFGVTVLWVVLVVVNAKPVASTAGAPADKAFGPADFPDIFRDSAAATELAVTEEASEQLTFPVPAPPFSEGVFPCSDCHADLPTDSERRELAFHDDIAFDHDSEHRWCLDCHDAEDRDELRLASGALVPFSESYRLCGQCHGTQFRDWRAGIHGKRTGSWNGPKRYLLCVHCHNPHSPRFASLKPLPPPVRPEFLHASAERPTPTASEEDTHARAAE